ncbi:MAG: HAD-IB family hydrolase [Coriobacteriia bacterium]|nr:HAD-IB family hydrolase [Coriobacteriia bacterium]
MGATTESMAPKELVVFDFDGTSISGESPLQLVFYLWRKGMLKKRVMLKLGSWGVRYKLRLPQDESWVRGLVFTAFEGKPKAEVDEFLRGFCDEVIVPLFRPQADAEIARHHAEGREVLLVTASFEPIIERIMELHAFDHQFSTRMRLDAQGNYTRQVEGLPVEGEEKLRLLRLYADEKYGEGKWVLSHAYGDHHSDRTLLSFAQHPCAVTPDQPLERTAKKNGWQILDWE